LYALIATTIFSSWVVDRAYHMDFFLLSGVLSAFHRRFLPANKGQEEDDGNTEGLAGPESKSLMLPATSEVTPAYEQRSQALAVTKRPDSEDDKDAENTPDQFGAIKLKWSRIGVVDMMIMYLILEVLLYFWELFSTDFVVF
jgi:hypothetical protein